MREQLYHLKQTDVCATDSKAVLFIVILTVTLCLYIVSKTIIMVFGRPFMLTYSNTKIIKLVHQTYILAVPSLNSIGSQ